MNYSGGLTLDRDEKGRYVRAVLHKDTFRVEIATWKKSTIVTAGSTRRVDLQRPSFTPLLATQLYAISCLKNNRLTDSDKQEIDYLINAAAARGRSSCTWRAVRTITTGCREQPL